MGHRDRDHNELSGQLAVARYRVDPVAVADATVRRRWSLTIAPPADARPSGALRRRSRARVSFIARHRSDGERPALAA